MVTTAAGLLIGIPAMALYFYLRGRLLRLTTDLEVVADGTAQVIIEKGAGG
jgi:biopolymer transport protein ExbB/TolQ